ncbi:MAG: chlorite dismutase family protein [Polyangiaceae bacterium]|nr:chlorite dismutase family protein [Polyangiaceae bacterium]
MSESKPGASHGHGEAALPSVDVLERGAPKDGQPQVLNRRLFMQLLVIEDRTTGPGSVGPGRVRESIERRGVGVVLYEDVNDPWSFGVLTWSEDPAAFTDVVRPAMVEQRSFRLRSEMTMLGRTYSTGYEQDLEYWMLKRPVETVTNPAWPWAIWYPLRRSGAFAKLEPREQGAILREHGTIGRAYGSQDLAHDIRLACQGLDTHDNDFVIGLVGSSLHPLSHVVQSMRKTRQTSEFITQMGLFFVGRVMR